MSLATESIGPGDEGVVHLLREFDARPRALFRRALAVREVDAGSCNGCEIEITGLTSPVYDSDRFGIHFVASPRHADLLLVPGPVTRNMEVPLKKTYDATPAPKLVVAVGDCARTCGVFKGSYAVAGSVTVSQQLAILRAKNIVTTTKVGTSVRYALRDPLVRDFLDVARRVFNNQLIGSQTMLRELRRERSRR